MKYFVFVFLVQLALKQGSCQSSSRILGNWEVLRGGLTENYGWPYFKKFDINITSDSIEAQSGFFYAIDDLTVRSPSGRFPFVYYGSKEKCELKGDSLSIYSWPYKLRNSYRISFVSSNKVHLMGAKDTIFLSKIRAGKTAINKDIGYIKIRIENYSIYKVSYSVTYNIDETMLFNGVTDSSGIIQNIKLKLSEGSFVKKCKVFESFDLSDIKSIYKSPASDHATIFLEIGLLNGKKIKSELQVGSLPPDLEMSLAPFLYGHQRIFYSGLTPKR